MCHFFALLVKHQLPLYNYCESPTASCFGFEFRTMLFFGAVKISGPNEHPYPGAVHEYPTGTIEVIKKQSKVFHLWAISDGLNKLTRNTPIIQYRLQNFIRNLGRASILYTS